MKYYKVLGANGEATNGGTGKWFLPHGKRSSKWMPKIKGELIACENGYHLCRPGDLLPWLGPRIFEAEFRGEMVKAEDKVVVREARLLRETGWNERAARLFACDCAEHVLPLFEEKFPDDKRPREGIETVRRFADGKATAEELSASRAAAWDAARDAAWDAAWDAARDAAGEAAWAAAWDAERKWQTKRLMRYLDAPKEEKP